ncbi:MAG: tRNA (adenosine(37)-N6)-dimethylallyltransferase MiaA [Methylocystaceae bacterium]
MNILVAIVGPTGVGKSEIANLVATRVNGVILSCDSMQIYRGLDIGSAKPELETKKRIPHRLIDLIEPAEEFTVAQYQAQAVAAIAEVQASLQIPILTGGTGLYYQAVVDGYSFACHEDARSYRLELQEEANQYGIERLYQRLQQVDPVSAEAIAPSDQRRIIRALEVFTLTGKPISEQARRQNDKYNLLAYGINRERFELYRRIDDRVDQMLAQGLVNEVEKLAAQGVSLHCTSMQGIGYKEIRWYLEGLTSYHEAVDLIKRESRRYAKRQITWFKRDPRIKWLDMSNIKVSEAVEKICEDLGRTLKGSVE